METFPFESCQDLNITIANTGDSGYALQNFLLTPFIHQNRSLAQESFNRSHKKTRVVIERAFGELKSRFRCLSKQGRKSKVIVRILKRVSHIINYEFDHADRYQLAVKPSIKQRKHVWKQICLHQPI